MLARTDSDTQMEISPFEKVLQIKCPLHPNYQSDILHVSAGPTNHRACIRCLLFGDVSTSAALDLQSILKETNDQVRILSFYPPLEDFTIYKRLESIQQYSVEKNMEQIDQFINDLKQSFDDILGKAKKDLLRSLENLEDERIKVIDLYQILCERDKLKEAVILASETNQESSLHELIVNKCKDSTTNTSKLLNAIKQFEVTQQKYSVRMVKESVEDMLKISFYTTLINSHSLLQEFSIDPSNLYDSASKAITMQNKHFLDGKCIRRNHKDSTYDNYMKKRDDIIRLRYEKQIVL